MPYDFVLLRLRTDEPEGLGWKHAVNVSQIVSIYPIHSETSGDPATAAEYTFYRSRAKDTAEATARGLSLHYQVVDSSGNVYSSSVGDNPANQLLGKLYNAAAQ